MALELQKGRPADTTGRLDKEIRTYDLLDRLGVEYDRVDHAPAMTMEDCKEVDEILESMVCKNLFLCNRQETAFYLLMIPDTKVFHTKDLSAQIGSARLSFEMCIRDSSVVAGIRHCPCGERTDIPHTKGWLRLSGNDKPLVGAGCLLL